MRRLTYATNKLKMKKIQFNTFEDKYSVTLIVKNKNTGVSEEKQEFVWAFGKEAHSKIKKKVENKYRGQGFKVDVLKVELCC